MTGTCWHGCNYYELFFALICRCLKRQKSLFLQLWITKVGIMMGPAVDTTARFSSYILRCRYVCSCLLFLFLKFQPHIVEHCYERDKFMLCLLISARRDQKCTSSSGKRRSKKRHFGPGRKRLVSAESVDKYDGHLLWMLEYFTWAFFQHPTTGHSLILIRPSSKVGN